MPTIKKIYSGLFYCVTFFSAIVYSKDKVLLDDISTLIKANPVIKSVLSNGLTILVRPDYRVPQVVVQLWYHVGSKDEKSHERGKAHMLEHMVFGGTQKLSETDIPLITNKLSGYCNAGTIHDYTKYDFAFPSCHWRYAMPILADCMKNCSFKDEKINSEVKAVIQELKMLRDNYRRTLFERMLAIIFEDHPYHYPVVGYKQDLWNMNSSSLHQFYKKHYVPNNATLVVVGDVDPNEVFELAQEHFGPISKDSSYEKETFYYNKDISSQSVTLYRDVQQPVVYLAFVVPGVKEEQDYLLNVISLALGDGKSSRLHQRLVDDLKIVTSVSCSLIPFFDHSIFFIGFEPHIKEDIDQIIVLIQNEIDLLAREGFKKREIDKLVNNNRKMYCDLLESYTAQANIIGKYFLATDDENYVFKYLDYSLDLVPAGVQELLCRYFRPSLMHKGFLLPLDHNEKNHWIDLQKTSDQEDQKILSSRMRESAVEPGKYVEQVVATIPGRFDFPKATIKMLSNGIKVLSYAKNDIPKVDLILKLKADNSYYDPDDRQGLYSFMSALLVEGTKNYTGKELVALFESHGILIRIVPGSIVMSMLADELELGLTLLLEILSNTVFDVAAIEKVRKQILVSIAQQADDPGTIARHLLIETIFKDHPFGKRVLGTKESITAISKKDIVNFYKKIISPDGARLAIIGDFQKNKLEHILEGTLGKWSGFQVEKIEFPKINHFASKEIVHYLNRDQILLVFAGLSVNLLDSDFDKLLIFNEIFSGGMNSKLFKLREQTGIFYTAVGAAVMGASDQPGIAFVQTLVSCDRLKEAQNMFMSVIDQAADTVSEQEFKAAKQNLIYGILGNFATNSAIAGTFLFLDCYNFSQDYFDNRAQKLDAITLEQMKLAAKKIMCCDKFITIKVGRVS